MFSSWLSDRASALPWAIGTMFDHWNPIGPSCISNGESEGESDPFSHLYWTLNDRWGQGIASDGTTRQAQLSATAGCLNFAIVS